MREPFASYICYGRSGWRWPAAMLWTHIKISRRDLALSRCSTAVPTHEANGHLARFHDSNDYTSVKWRSTSDERKPQSLNNERKTHNSHANSVCDRPSRGFCHGLLSAKAQQFRYYGLWCDGLRRYELPAIVCAGLAYWLLGAVWYSALFSSMWRSAVEEHGVRLGQPG